MRGAVGRSHQQPMVQRSQVESAVEAVGESGEIATGILSEAERMLGARQAGLQVAQHGVDPLELGQVVGLSPRHDGGPIDTAGLGD